MNKILLFLLFICSFSMAQELPLYQLQPADTTADSTYIPVQQKFGSLVPVWYWRKMLLSQIHGGGGTGTITRHQWDSLFIGRHDLSSDFSGSSQDVAIVSDGSFGLTSPSMQLGGFNSSGGFGHFVAMFDTFGIIGFHVLALAGLDTVGIAGKFVGIGGDSVFIAEKRTPELSYLYTQPLHTRNVILSKVGENDILKFDADPNYTDITEGAIKYDGGYFYGHNETDWVRLDIQSSEASPFDPTSLQNDINTAFAQITADSIRINNKVDYADSTVKYFTPYQARNKPDIDLTGVTLGKVVMWDGSKLAMGSSGGTGGGNLDSLAIVLRNEIDTAKSAIRTTISSKLSISDSTTKYLSKFDADTMRANIYNKIGTAAAVKVSISDSANGTYGWYNRAYVNALVNSVKGVSGTATVVSDTTVIVTHGYGSAPSISKISVTPQGNLMGASYWIESVNSINFTIHVCILGTYPFSWSIIR